MNRAAPILFRIICLVAVAAIFAGCGDRKRELVGKWRSAGDATGVVWEFSNNGAVTMGSTQGRYTFGDRDRIKIETGSSNSVYELALAGDRLTLKDPRGTKLEFARIKE